MLALPSIAMQYDTVRSVVRPTLYDGLKAGPMAVKLGKQINSSRIETQPA
jgi:hypothetical protein